MIISGGSQDLDLIHIYRRALQGLNPKSVALRREIDWHTGLSFQSVKPNSSYVTYRTDILIAAGYRIEFDEGQPIFSKQSGEPFLDEQGKVRYFGSNHVSVWREDDIWALWYEAERILKGSPDVSSHTMRFWELRELE